MRILTLVKYGLTTAVLLVLPTLAYATGVIYHAT
jgi:hypothetical protein